MSHTCGKKQLRDLAKYLKDGLAAPEYQQHGIGREAWFELHLERAIKQVEHIAECMEPGPDDPERESE